MKLFRGKWNTIIALPVLLLAMSINAENAPPVYTLVNSVPASVGERDCELIALAASDKSDIHVLRVEKRKDTYNANYFSKNQKYLNRYGTHYSIGEQFNLHPTEVASLSVFLNPTPGVESVRIKLFLHDGTKKDQSFTLDRDFFHLEDGAGCLY